MNFNDLGLINKLFCSIVILMGILMVFLNSILAYIIIKKFTNATRTVELKLMLILSIFEIYMGSVISSFSIVKLIYDYHVLDQGTKTCFANGFVIQLTPHVEICLVAVLSLLRCTIVCRQKEKSIRFWLVIFLLMSFPSIVIYTLGAVRKDQSPRLATFSVSPF
jgi:hypothetical protein